MAIQAILINVPHFICTLILRKKVFTIMQLQKDKVTLQRFIQLRGEWLSCRQKEITFNKNIKR